MQSFAELLIDPQAWASWALAFSVFIGVMLVVESTGQHVSKRCIYSATEFSLLLQVLHLQMTPRRLVREQAWAAGA